MTTVQTGQDAERGGVLANRDFTKLWGGETVSLVGSQVTDMALPLTAILTLHATAFGIGLLNVARYAPFVLVSLFAGVWFDRRRRRPTLIVSNLGRAVLIGLIPLAHAFDLLSMTLLYAVGFTAGLLTVLFDIGILSYVPGLVDKRYLAEANSKITVSYSVAGIAGPGLAGFLVGALSAPVALTVDAVSYLVSAAALSRIRRTEPAPELPDVQPSVFSSIAEGLRTVIGSRILRHLATQSATFNLFENVMTTIFLVYAVRVLGLSPTQLGFVVGAGSVGALLGAMLASRIGDRLGFGQTLRLSTLIACVSPLALLAPQGSGAVSLLVIGAALAVHGFHLAIFNINALTLRQTVTPTRLLGRMNASYRLVLFGTVPIGALLGGSLAAAFGLRAALVVGVIGIAAPVAWLTFSPVFRLREMPDGPIEPDLEANPAANPEAEGPDPEAGLEPALSAAISPAPEPARGPEPDPQTNVSANDRNA
ncbi:Transmembrane secretion effector [Streptomyces sp. DvalAA-14]|uniref:MFS transporter n=1 Tax=unclassified Streptomyces TaxID=2593676 RepID=UPI00081B3913|nr:MFS transporter [Streptomyces sp. DvalAA-14]MYS19642.1 MFS transporter [Streptomyces sp. SID4948]SCD49538.1 Transmembrane secretion effector [Streptomyces sp. DvalAA-14]